MFNNILKAQDITDEGTSEDVLERSKEEILPVGLLEFWHMIWATQMRGKLSIF